MDDMLDTALRQHADRLTAGVIDVPADYDAVARRARARRGRWMAVATSVAAAAAVAGVLVVASATGDRATIRSPATAPIPAPPLATSPSPTSTVPTPTEPTPTAPPLTTSPATSTIAPLPATPPATLPAAPPTVPAAEPTTETYEGIGGSITVRLSGDTLILATAPVPAAGFTASVDDNGPDRVRVRFERDDQRTEIRVDLEDGRLVPRIEEG
jgi:hypothetical protein